MRRIFLTLFAVISILTASAQLPVPVRDGRIEYTGVVETPNVSGKDLYKNTKYYLTHAFKGANDAIILDDSTSNTIALKSQVFVPMEIQGSTSQGNMFDYRVQVEVKDGKYRYTISGFGGHSVNNNQYQGTSNVSFDGSGLDKMLEKLNGIADAKIKEMIIKSTNGMLNNLNEKMTTLIAQLNANIITKPNTDF